MLQGMEACSGASVSDTKIWLSPICMSSINSIYNICLDAKNYIFAALKEHMR